MATDSAIPSYQPFKCMIAKIERITMETQNIETILWMKFLVAMSKTTDAKVIAIMMP